MAGIPGVNGMSGMDGRMVLQGTPYAANVAYGYPAASVSGAANGGAGRFGIPGRTPADASAGAAVAVATGVAVGASAGKGAAAASSAGRSMGTGQAGATAPTECATCANRLYQDGSTDAGVSFKTPGNIDPAVSSSAVMSHEQEHVALAQARAESEGGRIIASIVLHTAICPECGRVYVSGGEARITTITPTGDTNAAQDVPALPGLPGGANAEQDVPELPGMTGSANAEQDVLELPKTDGVPLSLETGGTDQFRQRYRNTMAANYGVFLNARV